MFRSLALDEADASRSEVSVGARWLCAVFIAAACGALIAALLLSTKAPPEITALVSNALPDSGVSNPVTAVLLNFRSYDTLLEIAVLLIVAAAMIPDRTRIPAPGLPAVTTNRHVDPILKDLLQLLVPIAIVVASYLLWTGAYEPGGAFQAGAILASAGLAMVLMQNRSPQWQSGRARASLVMGLLLFVAVAVACIGITGTLLQYPVAHAAAYILFIEIAATLSIAATLLLLFTCLADIPAATAPDESGYQK